MNKSELIDELTKHFDGNRRAAQHALDSVLDTVVRNVQKGEAVAITGFGKFEKRLRPARTARNPRTGESVKVKKTNVPKFTPGADFKAVVSGAKKLAPVKAVTKTAAKPAAKKAPAKRTTAKRTTARKAPAKKTTARKAPAKKTTARKAPAKKTTARKTTAKKTTARKTTAKKAPAKKTTARRR